MSGRFPSPRHFAVYGNELFFNAGRLREGYELWKLPLEALGCLAGRPEGVLLRPLIIRSTPRLRVS